MLAKSEDGCSWTEKQEPECLWFHGWLAAPWEADVLLWKKSARFQEILEVEIILNSVLSGSYFSVTFIKPQCSDETCLCWPSATAEPCVSCKGRCSCHTPAAPQQNFKGLVQLGLGSRSSSAWTWCLDPRSAPAANSLP